jgi:energy-coupling factor transporter transmembrane protein EcfT
VLPRWRRGRTDDRGNLPGPHSLAARWRALLDRIRDLVAVVRDMVALAVPAIVLATRRAWAMTEAAYARGFDSPHRRPYRKLAMGRLDWLLLAAAIVVTAGLLLWK